MSAGPGGACARASWRGMGILESRVALKLLRGRTRGHHFPEWEDGVCLFLPDILLHAALEVVSTK